MKRILSTILFFLLIVPSASPGQESDPVFSIEDVAWISGTWQGTQNESFIEEVWTQVEGSNMAGMFRIMRDGEPGMFEFMTIQESEGRVVLSIKHFNRDMSGWEEKDESELFTLVKQGGTTASFDHAEEGKSLTYERAAEELSVTLREVRDSGPTTVRFDFRLVQ